MTKNLILDLTLVLLAQVWTPKLFIAGFASTTRYTLFQVIIPCNLMEN